MKIYYPLLCYYPSQAGGPANTIYWLNKSMGLRGHEIVVISTNYGIPNENIDYNGNYEKFNIDAEFVNGSFFCFFTLKRVRKLLHTDIIHLSSLFFRPTVLFMLIGLLLNKKVLISPRGELYEAALSRKKRFKSLYLRIFQVLQKRISFHATNDYESSLIRTFFPKTRAIEVIPNYIDVPLKKEVTKRKQILFLGRINEIKNIGLLIRAYHQLPVRIKQEFKLVIAGEAKLSHEKEYLNELIELVTSLMLNDNIRFLGGSFGDDKEILLSESYCTVLPSRSENFGNVVLESLCQATPVIVSKNAPWQTIEEFKAGFWIDPSVIGIRNALLQILTISENEYQTFQINALSLALNHFDIKKNILKWEHFYKNLL